MNGGFANPALVADSIVDICGALGLAVAMLTLRRRDPRGALTTRFLVAMGLVAALFLPLRARVQRVVDRRFYRHRYDARRTIDDFAARLRQEIDIDMLRVELLAVTNRTMQPSGAQLWLRRPE